MKKVLIFSLAYFPHVGGAEVAIKELTDRINDIEFHMVTMRFSPSELSEEKIGNVYVYRIGSGSTSKLHKFLFQFKAARVASRLHTKNQYDAVWAMMAHSAGVPASLFKSKHPSVPLLLTLQEGDPPEQIERTMLPLWPWFSSVFTRADRVQAISNFLGQWARRRHFAGPLAVIPNGVDVKKFSGEQTPHEGIVLITTSRLVYKNAVDDVIRALPMLPEVRFKVLGIGPEERSLKTLAKTEGVENRIEFLGYISHDEMPAHLHRADFYIRPSRSEGQGASFIEAMAAGLPLIATGVGGIPDFLTNNETGFVVEPNNPKSIADVVQNALQSPELVRTISTTVKERAKKYDWDMIAVRMRNEAFEPLWQKQ